MTVIREIRPEEIPVLEDFLYEAIFIPEGVPAPPRSIVKNEDMQVYVRDFGKKSDDRCLVAEVDGKICRGRGIGTQLMRRMQEKLKAAGYQSISLSVQKANYALQMYRKVGFVPVADHGDELLMVCRLL